MLMGDVGSSGTAPVPPPPDLAPRLDFSVAANSMYFALGV